MWEPSSVALLCHSEEVSCLNAQFIVSFKSGALASDNIHRSHEWFHLLCPIHYTTCRRSRQSDVHPEAHVPRVGWLSTAMVVVDWVPPYLKSSSTWRRLMAITMVGTFKQLIIGIQCLKSVWIRHPWSQEPLSPHAITRWSNYFYLPSWLTVAGVKHYMYNTKDFRMHLLPPATTVAFLPVLKIPHIYKCRTLLNLFTTQWSARQTGLTTSDIYLTFSLLGLLCLSPPIVGR